MRVLVACEESQEVCKAFRALGHAAFSCDIQECSGGHPEWHIKGDVLPLLNGWCHFNTMDGRKHWLEDEWDLIIAHPPCTYLSNAGNAYFNINRYGEKAIRRKELREEGFQFFLEFTKVNCKHIAIENPIGCPCSHYRKADQIIHPYYFANDENDDENYHLKTTCLWLIGLPKLKRTNNLPKPQPIRIEASGKKRYFTDTRSGAGEIRRCNRSKTFPGIAKAMAEQWGNINDNV